MKEIFWLFYLQNLLRFLRTTLRTFHRLLFIERRTTTSRDRCGIFKMTLIYYYIQPRRFSLYFLSSCFVVTHYLDERFWLFTVWSYVFQYVARSTHLYRSVRGNTICFLWYLLAFTTEHTTISTLWFALSKQEIRLAQRMAIGFH